MLFSNFWEITRSWLGNPYQYPQISMVLHELTSLMQKPLISKATTIRLDQDAIQNLYYHPFLGPVYSHKS